MNREILFRGKRKQDGLWCHGDLVRLKDGDTQMPYIYYFGEVYPESIGQFTGVYDKNGDEIYEGDIEKDIRRAKIDAMIELKEKIVEHMGEREYMGVKYKQGVFSESEIDELIKEVENE